MILIITRPILHTVLLGVKHYFKNILILFIFIRLKIRLQRLHEVVYQKEWNM